MICTDNNKLRQLIARDDKRLKDISGPLTGAQRKTNQIRKAKRGDRNVCYVIFLHFFVNYY